MQESKVDISTRFANMSIISALMVVMIHVLKRPQESGSIVSIFRYWTGEGICRVAVPFFFLASGYFISNHLDESRYWKNEVMKRAKTLVIPFFAWSVICFVLSSILIIAANYLEHRTLSFGLFSFNRIARSLGIYPFHVPELRQLWFVRVLFVFVLVLPVFKCVVRKFRGAGIMFLFALYLIFKPLGVPLLGGRVWEMLNFGYFSFEGAAYFALGMFLYNEHFESLFSNRMYGLLSLLFGIAIMVLRCNLGVLAGVGFFASIPFVLYGILNFIPDRSFHFLQGYSFPIYLIHLNIVFVYFFILDYLSSEELCKWLDPGESVIGALTCFALVTGVSIGFARLLKIAEQRKPVIGCILFGGR